MIKLKDLEETKIDGKIVLLRADLDVPIQGSNISDDSRLEASLETIDYLLSKNCEIIICGHLGRPSLESGIKNNELSLKPIAEWYAQKFDSQAKQTSVTEFDAWEISENIMLLENLRLDPGEEENDEEFARKLSDLSEIYVNDAFASSHRAHASIVGVPKFLPHFAGFHLQKEVEVLSKVIEAPKRPLAVVIGGAKIETKLPLVEKMHGFADHVLVGGEIAEHTRDLLKVSHEKTERRSKLLIADLTPDQKDITGESLEMFVEAVNKSETVIWNGPLGFLEEGKTESSAVLADTIINSGAYSIVGGGDTVGFLNKLGLLSKFSFVSTGGGAMLEFLSGENLPGLEALRLT